MTNFSQQNNISELSYQELEKKINDILSNNTTVLFMKGEKEMPACGFSAGVVEALNSLNISFETINILADDVLRAFMKEYSNWPTYPQLYHKGKLIGGYDIVAEMYHTGELKKILTEQ